MAVFDYKAKDLSGTTVTGIVEAPSEAVAQDVLKERDLVNLIISKKIYNFFKTNYNCKLKLTYSIGYRIWRLNRFRYDMYKQSPKRIPE